MHAAKSKPAPNPDSGDGVLPGGTAASLIDALGGTDLALGGQAVVVSMAPLKEALGAAWGVGRAKIHAAVERCFAKHLTGSDMLRALDDCLYVVATPDKSAVQTLALCHRAMKDTVTYFEGRVRSAHLTVNRITRLDHSGAEFEACTDAELETAVIDARNEPKPLFAPKPRAMAVAEGAADGELAAWQVHTADGQHLRASFAVDPVMDLKAWAMAGHRIETRIMTMGTGAELAPAQRLYLQPWDYEKIDVAAVERGLSRLKSGHSLERPKLIVQLSFASLSNGKARTNLLDLIRRPECGMKQAAILEIVDIEAGVPIGRLVDVVAMVRGFFRTVWVQVAPSRQAVETAISAKITGLTVTSASLGDDDQAIAAGLRRFASMVKRPNTLMTVTSLPATNLMIDAMSAGFSHATLRTRQSPSPYLEPAPTVTAANAAELVE